MALVRPPQLGNGVDPVAAGHLDVHDGHLGGLAQQGFLQRRPGCDHPDHPSIGEDVEGLTQPFCEQLVVVGDHYTNHRLPHSTVTVVPPPGVG